MELCTAEVLRICKQHGFYSTPELNEKLYLHCKGLCEIKGLEEFVNARAIWLEGNCLDRMVGLEHNTETLSLYLARNAIERIEGLQNMGKLCKLDLSENLIRRIEHLEGCTSLQDLGLRRNDLRTQQDVEGLKAVADTLTAVDLSQNPLADPGVVDVLAALPRLASLRLMGTKLSQTMPTYRKTLITRLPMLKSLDDTPVTAVERAAATAFFSGGPEAERRVRAEAKAAEAARQEAQIEKFDRIIEEARARRLSGHAAGHTQYYKENRAGGAGNPDSSAGQGVRGLSLSEEVVDGVWDVARETDARDSLRQASLRPRTYGEATELINSNAAVASGESGGGGGGGGGDSSQAHTEVGSDWDSEEYDHSDPEEALKTRRDERRIARDRDVARRALNSSSSDKGSRVVVEEEGGGPAGTSAVLPIAAAGGGEVGGEGVVEEEEEGGLDYAEQKLRDQKRESAWARGDPAGAVAPAADAQPQPPSEAAVQGGVVGSGGGGGVPHPLPCSGGDVAPQQSESPPEVVPTVAVHADPLAALQSGGDEVEEEEEFQELD